MDGVRGAVSAQNLGGVELADAALPDAPNHVAHMHIFVQEKPRLNRSAWVNFGFSYHPYRVSPPKIDLSGS